MRTFRWMTALAALALAACGGGSGGCDGSFAGGSCASTATPPPAVAAIQLTTDTATVPSDGSVLANLTVVAKDANNNVVSGVTVGFVASGGSVIVTQAKTDATGKATATLSGNGLAVGTAIAVTASTGSLSDHTTISVVTAGAPPVVSLKLSTDTATIPSDGSVLANLKAVAKDVNNNAVSGVTITFAASAGNVVVTQAKTDVTGTATATLSGSGVAIGTVVAVTATAGSLSDHANVTVANAQRTLSLLTSLAQIPSDGSKSATITALIRDAANNVVPGVTVGFSSDSGALAVTQAQTDAAGLAKATLTAGTDPTNRKITVTATAGSASGLVTVNVSGTTLSVTAPPSLVLGSSAQIVVQLKNSSGQGIPSTPLTLTSGLGNALVPIAPAPVTDPNGQALFRITGTVSGTDTLTASGLGISQQATLDISPDNFQITSPANNTSINIGQTQVVTATWLHNGTPYANSPVTFTTTRGALTGTNPVNTDATGKASITVSSTNAGPAIVSAAGVGATGTSVGGQVTLQFQAVTASQLALQPNPAVIGLQGTSVVSATVLDAGNNPVPGASVDFLLATDPTSGGLSVASANTNAQGIAQTTYTAGNTSSGGNGVVIQATVHGTGITATAHLTVGGQTLFLSMGTGNTIDTSIGPAVYQVLYSVFAVDSSGAAVAGVPIALSVLPVAYGKGFMTGCPGGNNWVPNYTTSSLDANSYPLQPLMCRNEDGEYSGKIFSVGEANPPPGNCINLVTGTSIPSYIKDYNCDGKLEPGNVAVANSGSGVTDASGRLDVTIQYPRDHAYWTMVTLVASTNVTGTQSSTSTTFVLQGAISDYACSVGPPGPISPYGQKATCVDPR